MISTLNSQGQLTLPAQVREHLGVGDGDRLEFILDDGSVRMRPFARSVRDLAGILRPPEGRRAAAREMDDSIVEILGSENELSRGHQR